MYFNKYKYSIKILYIFQGWSYSEPKCFKYPKRNNILVSYNIWWNIDIYIYIEFVGELDLLCGIWYLYDKF